MDLRVKRLSRIRSFPHPEHGLRVLAERAPQAEAFAARSAYKLRPVFDWFYGARRRLATGGVLLLTAWLFFHVVFGANGMVVYRKKVSEYQSLQKQIKNLQGENQQDAQEIKNLQSDPETIEKEAREQLHYTRPGEVVYVSPAPPPKPSSPELKDAQK
jgi:cell division protein FtsB